MGKILVTEVWWSGFRSQETTICHPSTPVLKCEAGESQETHRSASLMYTAANKKRPDLKQGERWGAMPEEVLGLPHIPALTREHTQIAIHTYKHTLQIHTRLMKITRVYSRHRVFFKYCLIGSSQYLMLIMLINKCNNVWRLWFYFRCWNIREI